jgi:formylmethanofuran dehydrogenase subunit E
MQPMLSKQDSFKCLIRNLRKASEGPAFHCHSCGKFTSSGKAKQWGNHLYCSPCFSTPKEASE